MITSEYCFPYVENLTAEELKARDIMVNLFNPVLKFIFLSKNPMEFQKYGFNSCRQTAILGTYFLKKELPEYTVKAYEGQFIDTEDNGQKIEYTHAFITAENKNIGRKLIVDLSRTEKRILFHVANGDYLYPVDYEYSKVEKISQTELDVKSLLNMEEPEYYTSMKPIKVIDLISKLMNDLKLAENKDNFINAIYKNTTAISLLFD